MRMHFLKFVRNALAISVLVTVLMLYMYLYHVHRVDSSNSKKNVLNGAGTLQTLLKTAHVQVNLPRLTPHQVIKKTEALNSDEMSPRDLSETYLVKLKNATPEFSFRRNDFFSPSKCPKSLQKNLSANSWTSKLFHPEIKQLLTSTSISKAEYQRLVKYWMPFGFKYHKNFTYEELTEVLRLFPKANSIFDYTRWKVRPECISCAVVGNGGILRGSGMGKEIDGHDMVFRVNNCIRRGYEEDVGNRTTHFVLMDRSLRFTKREDIPRDEGIKYIFMPCREQDYKYISQAATSNSPKLHLHVSTSDVRILHPDFIRYVHKIWENTKSYRPTTGGMMFFTALHAGCDSVSVYGMGFTGQYSEHYYDKEFKKYKSVKGSHDFQREVEILKHLDQDELIRWYKRDVKEFNQRLPLPGESLAPPMKSAVNQSQLTSRRQSHRRAMIRETPYQLYRNAPDLVKLRLRAGLSRHWSNDRRLRDGIKFENLSIPLS